jgi:hypothetical protein
MIILELPNLCILEFNVLKFPLRVPTRSTLADKFSEILLNFNKLSILSIPL